MEVQAELNQENRGVYCIINYTILAYSILFTLITYIRIALISFNGEHLFRENPLQTVTFNGEIIAVLRRLKLIHLCKIINKNETDVFHTKSN